jgi:peptide/nickel transport system substrate-binding protein/oligopeptide transport system substrate-binding protein
MPPPPRAAAPGIATMAIALFAHGCTENARSTEPGEDPATAGPQFGGEFHIMLEAPGTLDPGFVDDVYEACVVNQLYDGLLEADINLNPVPAIAREWLVSRNGREYEFTLRDDVRFHNGREVTAHDFVYTFTRIFDPKREDHGLGGEYLRRVEGVDAYAAGEAGEISGLEAVGDRMLRIRLHEPYASFLSVLAMDQTKVVAREEIERWGEEYDAHPCGTGPFRWERFDEVREDPRIVLVANPDYFRGRPYVDRLVVHVPRDYNVDRGAEALLAGEITMSDLPGSRQHLFDSDPRFQIVRRPEFSFSFIGLNVTDAPMQDVRVRRAIAHAVDRERITALDPVGRVPALGILPPGMFGYAPESRVLRHDPAESRRLLAVAGHPGGEGLPSVHYWQADRGEVGRQADALLREDLAAVGLDVVFHYVEWDEFDTKLTSLQLPAFGLTWVADVPDPDSFLTSLFSTEGVYNLFEFSNAAVDSLLAAGSEMRSSGERAEVYRRAERLILEDAPVIPLFHLANNFAVRAEVQGLQITPFGLGNLALERVWLRRPAS